MSSNISRNQWDITIIKNGVPCFDGIDAVLLKNLSNNITAPLVYIWNMSLPLILYLTQSYWANHTIVASEAMYWTGLQDICQIVNNMWLILASPDTKTVNCGEPHGSILGPSFFLICINDLFSVYKFTTSVLVADDTKLFSSSTDLQTNDKHVADDTNLFSNSTNLQTNSKHNLGLGPVSRWKGRDTEVRDIAFHITLVRNITPCGTTFSLFISTELQK